MDIFDIIGTTPPEVTWCIACLFVMFFVGGFGCILLWIIYKHGKVVERKVRNTNGQMSLFSED